MIPDTRLQQILTRKDHAEALDWCKNHGYSEGWAIGDGALVIYDSDAPPAWLAPVLAARDDNGATSLAA